MEAGRGGGHGPGGLIVRALGATLGVVVLSASLLATAGSASAQDRPGPLLAYTGVSADRVDGLDVVDTGTGRQWRVADGPHPRRALVSRRFPHRLDRLRQ